MINYTSYCRFAACYLNFKKIVMGRGDKKTKKGKIFKGSFGKTRPARVAKVTKPVEEKKEA
ncbi:30S ribosomal protein THX [Segetibacter sp.]|uniref:30S ribosomal protein THX n=1 Tax=Segetibacter sp. TaxID=2231182 RepID=UPI00260AF163|nr:30S ribosomal protein THX [Segetibacter sp.]